MPLNKRVYSQARQFLDLERVLTMGCWARNLFIAVVVVLGIGQMMAACGQKGDLYLPPPESQKPEPKAAPEAADDVPRPDAR